MKFGLFFIGDDYPAERANVDFYAELLDQVAYAEALGFHSVWFADTFSTTAMGCVLPRR